MEKFDQQLYQILKDSGYVPTQQLEEAYKEAKELDRSLTDTLLFKGLIAEDALGKLVAEHLKVPYVSLKTLLIPDEILAQVPEKLARNYRMIPFEERASELSLAMEDPTNFEAIETVKRRVSKPVEAYYTSKADLNRALSQYKRDIKKHFERIIEENIKKASLVKKDGLENLLKGAQDLPVVKILDALLEYAAAENASDLHLENLVDSLLVRLRIDGVLHDILNLPKEIQPAIVARIKVLSNLKIDEHRIPQDGRFKFQMDEVLIALRVSIIPAFFGENVVLRLLPESARPFSLEELGLTTQNLKVVQANIEKPHGMILVTGPTGCGKTTTLYSILNILNSVGVKICTIEDPIEYGIHRISQIQVNTKTGLTFAAGLRSLLRHDPDIIMVGEVRDEETASMAIHSALTGHLVLSTLHTNDAPSSLPRFLDMGAEGYLLASTLNIAVAQRLVRRICPSCIAEVKPHREVLDRIKQILGKDVSKQKFYKGKGCDKCGQLGYKGRVGIFEVMAVNDQIRELTLRKASAEQIRKAAIQGGMKTMFEDGLDKIAAGQTSIEEVLAAVRE